MSGFCQTRYSMSWVTGFSVAVCDVAVIEVGAKNAGELRCVLYYYLLSVVSYRIQRVKVTTQTFLPGITKLCWSESPLNFFWDGIDFYIHCRAWKPLLNLQDNFATFDNQKLHDHFMFFFLQVATLFWVTVSFCLTLTTSVNITSLWHITWILFLVFCDRRSHNKKIPFELISNLPEYTKNCL